MEAESRAQAYWNRLKTAGIKPNFWMSTEYISRKGLVWAQEKGLEGWKEDPESDTWFFVPTTLDGLPEYNANIYAGMTRPFPERVNGLELLDMEFIYDPNAFLSLKGKQWDTYRKNIRKYERRFPGNIVYRAVEDGEREGDIEKILLRWTEGKEIWDAEVMTSFVLCGRHRFGLFRNGELVGLNVMDRSWAEVIFRYCLDDGTPYLNEYLRYLFYTSEWVRGFREKGMLVNDGGCLGSYGLENYKRKLNPLCIHYVFSHRQGGSHDQTREGGNGEGSEAGSPEVQAIRRCPSDYAEQPAVLPRRLAVFGTVPVPKTRRREEESGTVTEGILQQLSGGGSLPERVEVQREGMEQGRSGPDGHRPIGPAPSNPQQDPPHAP